MLLPGVETKIDSRPYSQQCGLRVKMQGTLRARQFPVFPALSGRRVIGIHNNSLNNGIRAMVERVFLSPDSEGVLTPPPPCTARPFVRLQEFRSRVWRNVGEHQCISREKFLEYYKGRRFTLYQNAVASLEARPLTVDDCGVQNAFVKAEKIDFSSKPDPAPRVIQPRGPRYNVEVGCYLRPLEHSIYHAVAEVFGGPTVMKGYTAEEVGQHMATKWGKFRNPVAVGLDASRFDQHVRPEMLEWEHSVYLGCFGNSEKQRLRWLLSHQIVNKGRLRAGDGVIKYKVNGSRMSGDMNTSLGNCLIMCGLVWTLARERGVQVELANNGDDCVVFLEMADLDRLTRGLKEWFLEFGFKMKVEEPVQILERVEFCQMHPVFDGEKWVMVRNPGTTASKDAVCTVRDYGYGIAARKWLGAVGECGIAMTGGIPVVQDQYRAFQRHGIHGLEGNAVVAETGMAILSRGCTRQYREPTTSARVSFYLAFGITPYHQECLETAYREVAFKIPASPRVAFNPPVGQIPL